MIHAGAVDAFSAVIAATVYGSGYVVAPDAP